MVKPPPFQIRRTDFEVAGDKLHRFELIDTTRGNMVLCVSRNESAEPPRWIINRCVQANADAAKAGIRLCEMIHKMAKEGQP